MERIEEERACLERCLAGDTAAFEPIVVAYRARAYHYALSILRNHHDALDLSQEAFARAYRSLKRFDTERPFLPWFLRIVRNLCLNHLRRREHMAENPGPEDGDEFLQLIPSPGEKPDAAAARSDRAGQVREALQQLTADQREIIFLRHFEDMSYESMAQVLDIPIGTVMSRLFNARRRLAEVLKSMDIG